jgi:HK97 family phage portal protein
MSLLKSLEIAWKWRGQEAIHQTEGGTLDPATSRVFNEKSYDFIEVVRRGTDLIVDSTAEIDINITDTLPFPPAHGPNRIRAKTLLTVLNFRPNPGEDVNTFRRQLVMDFVLTGNCFQYWDGRDLYHLPSRLVKPVTSKVTKIKHYEYQGKKFTTSEIIHTKDNSATTVYTGTSRLKSARRSINILQSMLTYQETFFENGAVPGLIIQTPNILGARIKEKLVRDWVRLYKPNIGGKRPMLLDGDMKVNPLSATKFSELEFEESVTSHETKILKALGIPPVLLNSGNNANLRPNIQLFYETTVLPVVTKLIGSYEKFFAWDMEPEVAKVRALRPELKEAGQYYTGLVNNGIMTPNEARVELRLDPVTDPKANELREPQNITGSATDPAEGGRPEGEGESEDE